MCYHITQYKQMIIKIVTWNHLTNPSIIIIISYSRPYYCVTFDYNH